MQSKDFYCVVWKFFVSQEEKKTKLRKHKINRNRRRGDAFELEVEQNCFFFFVATSGKEHTLAALFYLLNKLYLCFVTENKDAAIYLLYIHAGFFLIFTFLMLLKRIYDRDNDRKVSKLRDYFLFFLLDGKVKLFKVFFGPIYQLLPVSGAEPWVHTLSATLFLQVLFLNILVYLFKSLTSRLDDVAGPNHSQKKSLILAQKER